MAKIETKVVGTTFYPVDFASINTRSRVVSVAEPENPYDENAIKVLIDGRQSGTCPAKRMSPSCSSCRQGTLSESTLRRWSAVVPAEFVARETARWQSAVAEAEARNGERNLEIARSGHLLRSREFWNFLMGPLGSAICTRYGGEIPREEELERARLSGYVTPHEEMIFSELSEWFPCFRQVRHKITKSGLKVEDCRLSTSERLIRIWL